MDIMDDTDKTPETTDDPIKLPSDTEIILNSIKELSRQISTLQSQIREMRQELSYVNSANTRRPPPYTSNPNSVSHNPFYHTNEPPHRIANNNNYNNDYYNNLLGVGRHY
jgi:hypothetical protein